MGTNERLPLAFGGTTATPHRAAIAVGTLALREPARNPLFERVCATVAETLGTDWGVLYERGGSDGCLRVRAGLDTDAEETESVPAGRASHAGYTVECADPVVVREYAIERRFERSEPLRRRGASAGLCVVVGPSDEPWGVLGVHATAPRQFGATDVQFLELVANTLAVAIQRERASDRADRQRERFDHLVTEFAHDVRNPLTVADGRLRLAADRLNDESLRAVGESLDRIESLTDQLVSLTRRQSDIGPVERVRLGRVAREAWATVPTADAVLSIEEDFRLEADPDRLRQLLENLFRNAVEHGSTSPDSHVRRDAAEHGSGEHDPITVHVGRFDGGFYVVDDGVGISEPRRKLVFEFGYTTSPDGSGVGLDLVERIAHAHGWQVDLSDGVDGGLRVSFTGLSVSGPAGS